MNRNESQQICEIDLDRFLVIAYCMETYGMEYRAPEDEWVWNVISRQAVAYSCGAICREGDSFPHNHDPDEIERCKVLSAEAAKIMAAHHIHEADEECHSLLPFYVAANEGVFTPKILNEETIRSAFGGTIYPFATVVVEPLHDWVRAKEKEFVDYLEEDGYPEDDDEWTYEYDYVKSWRTLTTWFHQQPDLTDASFISIDIHPDAYQKDPQRQGALNQHNGGCVFPRLAIALTPSGSLVGIGSCVVHT